jgi:NAD(P)-dependent dehydrogenase (short-subunit alcohol dehydrogenase family)
MKIATIDRHLDESQETVAKIKQDGGDAVALLADVSRPEQLQEAIESVDARWGRIDFVFANAGINGVWAGIEELDPEDWDKTITINLKGTFLTVKYAVPYLKRQGGSIVVTSSVNGTRIFSNTGATAYACSKAGQVAFTKMMAVELARHKIRINVICPGAVETNINENTERVNLEEIEIPVEYPEGNIPLTGKKPASAFQVAHLVHFLASPLSSHITGTEIWIDGAESLLQG